MYKSNSKKTGAKAVFAVFGYKKTSRGIYLVTNFFCMLVCSFSASCLVHGDLVSRKFYQCGELNMNQFLFCSVSPDSLFP